MPPTADDPPEAGLPQWGLGDVAITLVATLLLGTAVALVVRALEAGPWSSPTAQAWASLLLLMVPWITLAGWPVLASRARGFGPRRDFNLALDWRQAFLGFLGGVAALVLGTWVQDAQEALTGHALSSAVGDLAKNTTSASAPALAILALCTVVGAPLVEETAFRGLAFGAFRKAGVPVAWSVVWTTALFALFHFEPARLAVLLVVGGCLGVVRAYTGSTAASMVTHLTVNLPGAVAILSLGHFG